MRVLLANAKMPEQKAWFDFPLGASHMEHDGLCRLREIAGIPGTDRTADLLVRDMESPIRSLHCFVPENASPEQLNTLAIKLRYMSPEDMIRYEGALNINCVDSMEDVLRLADGLECYDVYPDTGTEAMLGRYLVNQGIVEFPEEVVPYLNFASVGTEYHAGHSGAFCGTNYIVLRENAPELALDGDRPQIFKVHLYTPKVGDTLPGPYRLTLPACEERLEQVKKLLGVEELAEADIVDVEYPLTDLQEYLSLDGLSVETLSKLADEIETVLADGELMKLCAVLEAEQPQVLDDVLRIVRDMDDYEYISHIRSPDEYGRYVLKHARERDIDILEDLDGFIDEDAYGKYRMQEDGVAQTPCGLVLRLSEPFAPQLIGQKMW